MLRVSARTACNEPSWRYDGGDDDDDDDDDDVADDVGANEDGKYDGIYEHRTMMMRLKMMVMVMRM